jgi:hypothetical protein
LDDGFQVDICLCPTPVLISSNVAYRSLILSSNLHLIANQSAFFINNVIKEVTLVLRPFMPCLILLLYQLLLLLIFCMTFSLMSVWYWVLIYCLVRLTQDCPQDVLLHFYSLGCSVVRIFYCCEALIIFWLWRYH